jgi:hypothetical protein
MINEVHLIVRGGGVATYKTGAIPNGIVNFILNDGSVPPFLTPDILNAFITQVTNGGDSTIKAYDSSDVLLATYHLDPVPSTVSGVSGEFSFALVELAPPDPNLVYITFQLGTETETYLDLYPLESISQNWAFQDVGNFQALGDFTREFRIPASDRNVTVFGFLDDSNYLDSENIYATKIPAEIRVDTVPIVRGHLRVMKTFRQNDLLTDIQVTFYGETPDLFRSIGDGLLGTISRLPTYNHVIQYGITQDDWILKTGVMATNVNIGETDFFYPLPVTDDLVGLTIRFDNGSNIMNRVITSVDIPNSLVIWNVGVSFNYTSGDIWSLVDLDLGNSVQWGLVDRGQNWDQLGSPNSRPVSNSEQPIYAADLTPFVNAWELFEGIITDAGFILLPTPLESILTGYWVPWINSQRVVTEETASDIYFNAGLTAATTAVTDNDPILFGALVDNGGNYSATGFVAPNDGFYTFRFFAHVQPVGTFGANTAGITFRRYTSPIAYTTVVNLEIAVSGTDQNNGVIQAIQFTTDPLFMNAGDEMRPYSSFPATPLFIGSATNDPLTGSGWELVDYFRLYGDTFDAVANAPVIKKIDFVKDVLNMHAGVMIPSRDVPREVLIVPIKDYINSGITENWTQKLDISKDVTLSPTTEFQKRNFDFTYKGGGDQFSKFFQDNGRVYGRFQILNGYQINSSAEPNEFANGDLKIQLTAESTPATYIDGSAIVIPKFINPAREFVIPNLRFLFLADIATVQLFDDYAQDVAATAVNIFNNYSSVDASVADFDLNFAPETPLHAITAPPFRNLFNEYWRPYLNGLYSPQARIMEAHLALDFSDVLSFGFNNRYWIKDSYWRILEISDYKIGLQESTKLTLLKVLEDVPDCSLVPVAVTVTEGQVQEVTFEDFNGDPQPANEICCTRYGYTWSEVDGGRCLAFGEGIDTPGGPGGGGAAAAIMLGTPSVNRPTNVLAATANAIVSPETSFSVLAGEKFTIEDGNSATLAVGSILKLEGANKGTTILGRNAYANVFGFHFGGGDRTTSGDFGAAQAGTVIFSNARGFSAVSQVLELFPSNDVAERLAIPDSTTWVVDYLLHASDVNGLFIYQTGSFYMSKISGVTAASAPISISSANSGTGLTLAFTIDTATDTSEHRFKVTSGGAGFPYTGVNVLLRLNYTQIR